MKQVDAVFFFVDPLTSLSHDPDIRALFRVCNVHNVPLATNVATADLIIAGLVPGEEDLPSPA
jgi:methylglyoxal synthase